MERIKGKAVGSLILGAILLLLPVLVGAELEPVGTHVFCSKTVTIGAKLGSAQPLRVHGTCTEILSIADTRVNITIIGDGCGKTIVRGSDPSASEIIQIRGRNIVVTNLEIHGLKANDPLVKPPLGPPDWLGSCTGTDASDGACNNNRGIRLQRGGIAQIGRNVTDPSDPTAFIEQTGVCIHHVSKRGIEITQGSIGRVVNSEIHDTGGDGISVSEGSVATIGFTGGELANLPGDAFQAQGFSGPNFIHDTKANGVTVDRHSNARITGNRITGNAVDGIRVRRHSHADAGSNLLETNGANGIRVDDNSHVTLGTTFSATCTVTPSAFGFTDGSCTGNLIGLDGVVNVTRTAFKNTSFGVKCSVGGSVTGKLTTDRAAGVANMLTGTGGQKSFGAFGVGTNDNCIDKSN